MRTPVNHRLGLNLFFTCIIRQNSRHHSRNTRDKLWNVNQCLARASDTAACTFRAGMARMPRISWIIL